MTNADVGRASTIADTAIGNTVNQRKIRENKTGLGSVSVLKRYSHVTFGYSHLEISFLYYVLLTAVSFITVVGAIL